MSVIAILGTMDSKGLEHDFVAKLIRARGHETLIIDLGTGGEPQVPVDIDRFTVAAFSELDLQSLISKKDRGECVVAMSKAAPLFVADLVTQQKIDGIISLGGGGGTALGTAVMRALPIGFPKVMVSTLASGNTAHYLGTKDIVMIPSIVDVAGLNRISKKIFSRAAGAISGMVEQEYAETSAKPLIVASMFGNTTECINIASKVLEAAGYEVLVFHATGMGGKTMEGLIESGMVEGVLDLTTTEWADEITGATLSAGPTRMDAMSIAKVPAVIAPGCVDMANFGEEQTVPEIYAGRTFYIHNPQVTLMRTNMEENKQLGEIIAKKANANTAPTVIMLPKKAISIISAEGQAFYDQKADQALFDSIKNHSSVEVIEIDEKINSEIFAQASAHKLLELIKINKEQHHG
ncbi:Tm-1-like ATP-binding domain-containing protein [Lentisphaera profundi]|uniref:Tm-1-like ATP-binding domain-containing protein n=1 Tax=Lentisphaera profundi TaxID=1658616 RepID=A0ABY7VS84_9BACT|nr:Tm-1-like ATP-binding domain-containing protein [Lentisphaera profundi]WDE95711.1 Tm-1-like ATP-binding domain-containing protein [Lentisphaera profundi]